MDSSVEIRRFEESDAAAASRIICACFTTMNLGDYTSEGITSQVEENSPAKLIENSKATAFFVALVNGEVVGIGGHSAEKVRTVFVDPALQRSGIGSLILSAVLSDARNNGIRQLECWSTPLAERFYTRKGFAKVGLLDNGEIRFVRMMIDLGAQPKASSTM